MVGSHSGGIRHEINHVGHILHQRHKLEAYEVRCIKVKKNPEGSPVTASLKGPLTWLAVLGCVFSIALIALAIVYNDGMSLLATILLSTLSSVIGVGSKWTLRLPQRKANRPVPRADVVISYPNGAFLIVQCDESIARELYWAPEKCDYMVPENAYLLISLVGTLLLMFGVIALGNATFELQLAVAASYIILNAAYWIVAALPDRWHWNLSSYIVEPQPYIGEEEGNDNFTAALWKAIAITRSVEWATIANIAPSSRGWKEWLEEAKNVAELEAFRTDPATHQRILPVWDCQKALDHYLIPDSDKQSEILNGSNDKPVETV